jgi:tetratricopeptide (TPR) repeat protein
MNEPHDPHRTVDVPSTRADSFDTGLGAMQPGIVKEAEDENGRPGAAAPASDLPAVPGYGVLREIARGGMGRVLAAYDLGLDRDVALKVLLPGAKAERFVRESKITARLPHPGIPPVYALGTLADGAPFLAMKLVAGQTLAAEMKTAERPRLLQAFTQVCQAVGFAHSRSIIHRDLKPSNVMVGAFGEVQVMDWGLAKDLTSPEVKEAPHSLKPPFDPARPADPGQTTDHVAAESTDDRTQAGTVLGTPAYMAPEQARGEPADARADVFALGGILCAILTGQPPFGGKAALEVIRRAAAADLVEANARLDACGAGAELVALCRRCLSPVAGDRPADGLAVADGLTAYLDGVQERLRRAELDRVRIEGEKVAADLRMAEQRRRFRLTLALAATVLLAVTLGSAGWLWVKAERDARQTQVTRDVNDAMNKANAFRLKSNAANAGSAELFAQTREQVQRALALVEDRPDDDPLKTQVRQLQAELDEAGKDRTLVATLDEAHLAQANIVAGENRFAGERAVPKFREAFRAYGLPVGEGDPAAVAAHIRGRPPAVREAIVATLDDWDLLAGMSGYLVDEPHRDWLRAVLEAADPDNGWNRRVRAARLENDPAKRRAAAEALAEAADVERLPARALTQLAAGLRPPQAVKLMRRAQRQHPGDFWVNHDLGMALRTTAPPEGNEAVRFLTVAAALRPESPGANYNLGLALQDAGRKDDAILSFQKARALDPKYAMAHYGLGYVLAAKGEFDGAIASYRTVIELDSTNAQAHAGLALALQGKGMLADAIASWRKVIDLDSKDVKAHYNMGLALVANGKPDDAAACWRKAIDLDPTYAQAHLCLGAVLCDHKRDYDAAIACFHRAIALDPKDARAHSNLGHAQGAKGQLDAALASCRKAVEIDPTLAMAHNNLGNALNAKGRLDEAIASYRQALELDPDVPFAHDNLAIALYRQGNALNAKGQIDEAIASYRKAIDLVPTYAEAHCNLGHALRNKGRFAEAVAALRRGHELGTKHPGWRYPSAGWVREAERLAALEAKLSAFLKGEFKPKDTAERLGLVGVCQAKNLPAAAVRLSADAFAADPKLADDLQASHRYNAACSAALAAAGRGADAGKLDDKERTRLRKQALDWLRADLALRTRQLESGPPSNRAEAQQALQHWQQDGDLASLRDKDALAKLPAEERAAFTKLWADVAVLLKKAAEKAK